MARVFPDHPSGNILPEVARTFRALKALPEDWHVWLHLASWEPEAPDFLVLAPDQRAMLFKISRTTPRQAQQAPQMQLLVFEQETCVPGAAEELGLDAFLGQVTRAGVPRSRVGGGVVFPNLTAENLQVIELSGTQPQFSWLDKAWVKGKGAPDWEALFPPQPLDAEMLARLRAQFAPEIVVPKTFLPRVKTRTRGLDAGLTPYLLDYDQEALLKTDLDLKVEGENLARDMRVQVVNGVAGSGKTLVLLYRLRLLHERFPKKDYLVLTHNRPLIRDIQTRYQTLSGADSDRIRWYTFMGWCRRHWPADRPFNPLSMDQRRHLLRDVWSETLSGTSISPMMFSSELEWLKDMGMIHSREGYLEARRRGRGFRLTEQQRGRLFTAMQTYQQRLLARDAMDWWDVPRRYWRWLDEGQVHPPRYDVILVDEAQFFAPIWFNIVRQLILPEHGYLFLAADPTQGFLRRGESWKAIAGVDARGRSQYLRRSYRTTRAILSLALAFYRQRLPEDDVGLLGADLSTMQPGRPSFLLNFDAPQDERTRIVREIVRAVDQGVFKRHILVLQSTAKGAQVMIALLNQHLGEGAARDPKDESPGEFIRVTTLNAGTGLEASLVFLGGIHELFEMEGALGLSDEERAALIQVHTRKLYMAFTRAGQRLVLTYVGQLPPALQALLKAGLLELLTG